MIISLGNSNPVMSSIQAPETLSPNESEDSLVYYKAQYEQLEAELADFQASSRELETELERDVEASEKRERLLQEKVENLRYEVEEWKVSRLITQNRTLCTFSERPSLSYRDID